MKVLRSASLLSAMFIGCAAQSGANKSVVLTTAKGGVVEVPLSGPGFDPRAVDLASDIQALDKQITQARKAKPAASPDMAEIRAEMLEIAVDSRNDALSELDLALSVARKTSAGALDDEAVARAKANANSGRAVLSNSAPSSVIVATDISSAAKATLHYMSKASYQARSTEWSSYTEGERMRIGRYMFRVQPADANTPPYTEVVLILADPTRKRLVPVIGSSQ